MAEAFSERPAVHGKVFVARLCGVIGFPNGGGSQFQHPAPVVPHKIKGFLLLPDLAQGCQLVKLHVRRGDLQDVVVQDHMVADFRFPLISGIAEKNSKHIGIPGHCVADHPVLPVVEESVFFVAPENLHGFLSQQFRSCPAKRRVFGIPCEGGTNCHGFQAPGQQKLLKTHFSGFVNFCPVNKHPVAWLAFHESPLIAPSQAKLHQGFHFGEQLPDKCRVTGVEEMVINADHPVEGVIEDGVDMGLHGIMAAEGVNRSLVDLFVKEGIKVHQVTLVSIPAPYPPVALDPVEVKLPGVEMEGVERHVIYPVEQGVGTGEITPVIDRKIFRQGGNTSQGYPFIPNCLDIPECPCFCGVVARNGIADLQVVIGFGFRFCQRFLPGLPVEEPEPSLALQVFNNDFSEALPAKIHQQMVGSLFRDPGRHRSIGERKGGRRILRIAEIVRSGRVKNLVLVGYAPGGITPDGSAFDQDGRESLVIFHQQGHVVFSCR